MSCLAAEALKSIEFRGVRAAAELANGLPAEAASGESRWVQFNAELGSLDDADFGAELNCCLVALQGDESLFLSVWPNKGIDSPDVSVESLLEGSLDVGLGGLEAHNENKSVLVLHQLGSGLSDQWVFDH